MNRLGFIFSSLLVLLGLASSTLFVVDQRQFGVVYALGQIKEVITEPGLNFKLPPPFQNVSYIDKRLLTLDSTDTEPMLTAEKQRVVIDWYVRWRISEPTEYIRNVGTNEAAGASQLNRVVRNAFQEEINKRTVKELLSLKREALMTDVKREVLEKVRGEKPWGVDVVDVRITRVDYVEAITESVYRRMEAERKRVANELRSTGGAEGEKIRADADRQREVAVANAYQSSRICGDKGGTSVQNVRFQWRQGNPGCLNDLVKWADGRLLILVFGPQPKAALKRLQELSASGLPVRCVQVLAKGEAAQAREHLLDTQNHLRNACGTVPPGGWALIRPDGYLADTGKGVTGELIGAVAASLGL
jgi:membrane protease subunit HflC